MKTKSAPRRWWLMMALGLGGCAVSEAPNPITESTISPPFDVDAAVHRARLAYAARSDGSFTASGSVYAVRARDGAFSFTPRHFPGAENDGERALAAPIAAETAHLEGAPVTVRTTAIIRGEPFTLGTGALTSKPGGLLEIDRGVAVEQLQNDEAEVEQSWRFAEEPAGMGDLRVRVELSGQGYVGATTRGHHFMDGANGVGVVYGPATWIDADGRSTRLTVDYQQGGLVITVPEAVLAGSSYPAVLDPTIGAEYQMAAAAAAASAASEEKPAVAYDGTNFLVVWQDNRNTVNYDIYGARVSAAGAVLDARGIAIATAERNQTTPSVAFNGTQYLVAWADFVNNTTTQIWYARVSTAGVVSASTQLAAAAGNQTSPKVAAMGSSWFIVWQDARATPTAAYVARVDAAGAIAEAGAPVSVSTAAQLFPSIACTATQCLVAYAEGRLGQEDIKAMRVAAGGARLDMTSLAVTVGGTRDILPDVATDGTDFLVVFQNVATGAADVFGQRVSGAGALLGTNFAIANATGAQQSVVVRYASPTYFVAWTDATGTQDIYGTRVQTDGTVVTPNGARLSATSGRQQYAALASTGAGYYLAWEDVPAGISTGVRYNVAGTSVTAAGVVSNQTGTSVALAMNRQIQPATIWDGSYYTTVFADARFSGGYNFDIQAVRHSSSGTALDASAWLVSRAAGNQTAPDIAIDPASSTFLVVWADQRSDVDQDIYGARIRRSGTLYSVLDTNGFAISTATGDQHVPRVRWNAGLSRFLVVWQDKRNGSTNDIYGSMVRTDATVDANFPITTAAQGQSSPALATNNTDRWLVVWQDQQGGANTDDIRGVTVLANGTLGTELAISSAANTQTGPAVVYNGTNFFVTWTDTRGGLTTESDIYGARVSPAGALLDASGVAIAATPGLLESEADLAVAGTNYFIVWRQSVPSTQEATDLYGQRFTFANAPVEAARFLVAGETGNERRPSVAARSDLLTAVYYQRFMSESTMSTERVRGRTVRFP